MQDLFEVIRQSTLLEKVRENPSLIAEVKNPIEELQLQAVSSMPQSIRYITHPTRKVVQTVILTDPKALSYISNPRLEMIQLAVTLHPDAIRYVSHPSKKIQLIAVKSDPLVISYIRNPSTDAQMYVLNHYQPAEDSCFFQSDLHSVLRSIQNPCKAVLLELEIEQARKIKKLRESESKRREVINREKKPAVKRKRYR